MALRKVVGGGGYRLGGELHIVKGNTSQIRIHSTRQTNLFALVCLKIFRFYARLGKHYSGCHHLASFGIIGDQL